MSATAPRYLTRFQCLADTCEDTCCAGLVVPVSDARWRALRAAVAGGPDAARVEALVLPDPGGAVGAEAAYIAKREDGSCSFLDEKRLCSLHRAYGEAVLPDACAMFPRVATRRAGRLEVTGSFGCPEVVRLCLLAEDALEPVSVDASLAARPELARALGGGDAADVWTWHALGVREVALRILERREYPYASRLFMLGELARRLGAFYFRGAEASREEARLISTLSDFEAPSALDGLHAMVSSVRLPGGPWAGICGTVLRARIDGVRGARFQTWARAIQTSYGGASATPDDVWALYSERRARLEPALGERIEQYFRHHAVNHWLRNPFTDTPSVMDYVFKLTLRAAVLRWALFGHPEVVALCEDPPLNDGLTAARARLDAAAVECFQLSAKHLEQSPELHDLARGLSGGAGPEALPRMLVLLQGM
ncbi:flagellin lysine-N-methylase [Myxococcus sp. K38C18041901]|uniref:flagellin lysine-N-methylase n=1 Tax=Myxococcus guangdongensis TaxID=2906760 RepID=UPI0020A76CCF|nr:flagellin lysine-N-methylase [Myxococcus guangdongensis]MCP3059453.1 flagellin lysine-N-methylase [Myxococcus guangdongensis]